MTTETRGASPEQLERDIAATRMEIDSTLAAIQDKLSPGQILDQALRYMKDNGGQLAGNVGRSVRDNPIPLALVGIGLSWLMVSGSRGNDDLPSSPATGEDRSSVRERAAHTADAAQDRISSTAEQLERKASELAGEGKEKLRDAGETTQRYGEAAKDRLDSVRAQTGDAVRGARNGAYRAKDSAIRFFDEHPLVVGALAVAAGAALGALLPATRRESDVMGDESKRVREAAKEEAEETVHSAKTIARAVKAGAKRGSEAASDEGSGTGTPEGEETTAAADGRAPKRAAGSASSENKPR